MQLARRTAHSRARLDERFARFRPVENFRPPERGWIRAIREALGMSTAQLAKRLGVRQPSVLGMERSEEKGTIELATLRRAAEALDCSLVYALVPNQSLDKAIEERAHTFLRQRRRAVEHTMRLENQHVVEPLSARQLEDVIRETNPRRFWD